MWPVCVVLDTPGLDDDLGFEEGAELLDVEQLVAHPAIERLDVGVLPRGAGLDVDGPRPGEAAPVRSAQAMSSGPLSILRWPGAPRWATRASMTASSSSAPQVRPTRIARASRVLVDDVGQLEPAPVGGLVELEVDGPDMVRMLGAQALCVGPHSPVAACGTREVVAGPRPARGAACACG